MATPTKTACPPSAVVDQIIPWAEVREGDLALWDGELRLVEWNLALNGDPELRLVMLAGDPMPGTIPCGTYTAVRRYQEGAEPAPKEGQRR